MEAEAFLSFSIPLPYTSTFTLVLGNERLMRMRVGNQVTCVKYVMLKL